MEPLFAKDNSKLHHVNERMRTNFANSGRIAGLGVLYDDFSEDSSPGKLGVTEGTPVYKQCTEEEKELIQNGGKVKTYRLSRAELIEKGYIKESEGK